MSKPKGTNDSSTIEIFKERGVYKDTYPVDDNIKVNPIDLWSDYKLFYGRLDVCGNPVYLRQEKLTEIV